MIKKKDLIKTLDELIMLEKSLVPLLGRDVLSSMPFSSVKRDECAKIMRRLKDLSATQDGHVILLAKLKERVLKEGKDVY
jgi:hypothetical protein